MSQATVRPEHTVLVDHAELVAAVGAVFAARGVPPARATLAATALCYGDLTGMSSHGTVNLTRLYLPLFAQGRVDPVAEPEIIADTGACVLLDARRALGLWAAAEAMDLAVARAGRYGVGVVSVRSGTHFGCAGFHTRRAALAGRIGVVAANCGQQRIARPPDGRVAMLGTNPLSVAAPAGTLPPFVLDMSSTVVPTGRVRAAARQGRPIPAGWLADNAGRPVTDPAAFDRHEAFLRWLGGDAETGGYKGYGLGIAVEVLAALLSGAGLGPAPEALRGDGGPTGRDDDIGFLLLAFAPLRPEAEFTDAANGLFGALLACPPARPGRANEYPGYQEASLAARRLVEGVPLDAARHAELAEVCAAAGVVLRHG